MTPCHKQASWRAFRLLVDARYRKCVWNSCAPLIPPPHTHTPPPLPPPSHCPTGASRADFAVKCESDATVRVGGVDVARIIVGSSPASSAGGGQNTVAAHPFAEDGWSQWSAKRPAYLQDLRDEPSDTLNRELVTTRKTTVNRRAFSPDRPTMTVQANAVQSWEIGSGGEVHPFHLHVYHFQTVGCSGYEDGEWYDVIDDDGCRVLFDLRSDYSSVFSGRTIMHC